ncbi:MAG: CPBP family intramembrane metalloprotease [Oscillospiraceae bacterium]|jgi:membrane protease YdiL (CAAX protease family)|nr:CPBP family intramembrane metalloprotease [Oscillospiraceae bacterium]
MATYPLPRRIWRILYPAIIFLVLINAVTIGAMVLFSEWLDIMWCSAIGDLFAGAALVPIWLKERGDNGGYTNARSVPVLLLTAGLMVGGWFLFIGFTGVTDIVNRFFPEYMELNNSIIYEGTFLSQLAAFVIMGPVVEEICFRGIILKRMLKWLPAWAAILIQAALFGAVHMNPFQSLYAACIGLLFGVIYTRFRSVLVNIAAHFAFNFTQVLITATIYRTQETPATPDETGDFIGSLIFLAIGVVVFAGFGFFLLKQKRAVKIEPEGGGYAL